MRELNLEMMIVPVLQNRKDHKCSVKLNVIGQEEKNEKKSDTTGSCHDIDSICAA